MALSQPGPVVALLALRHRGLTLLELVLVVSILLVVAMVGWHNFQSLALRAKVARVQSDLRIASQAVGAYLVDHNQVPEDPSDQGILPASLTTPIAYLAFQSYADPLTRPEQRQLGDQHTQYRFTKWATPEWIAQQPPESAEYHGAILRNYGRWKVYSGAPYGNAVEDIPGTGARNTVFYDPTNGTESRGRIFVSSKKAGWD
jgi:prepilin-type N-terminal cleavage/methylation domain-containing protein